MKTAIEKARVNVIDQAKLLVRQQASIDDVAVAVDRLEALELNPEAANEIDQPVGIPFKVARSGIPVMKCIVEFEGGIRIGVWVAHGWTTRAMEAARIEYKKIFEEDAPAVKDIVKPKQYIADKDDFRKVSVIVPYTATDGTPEELVYILDNRHKD